MKIVFLGTGGSQGTPVIGCCCEICLSDNTKDNRLRSSIYLETQGLKLIIDSGTDFRQQLLRENISSVDAILLTHNHTDHIIGLDDVRPLNFIQKEAMNIYAEHYVLNTLKKVFSYAFDEKMKYPGVPVFNLNTIKTNPFYIKKQLITPIRGYHYKLPVLGYRINNFCYFTDISSVPDSEKQKLQNLEVLAVSALRKEKHMSHFNMEDAINFAKEIKPRKTYLTHIGHRLGLYDEITKELPNNISLAYDQLKINLF